MRKIFEIKYETIIRSDVDENCIYAFKSKGKSKVYDGVAILARKNNVFYWNPLSATNQVWYKEYDSIEEAIEGVQEVQEVKKVGGVEIFEFCIEKEFFEWALEALNK